MKKGKTQSTKDFAKLLKIIIHDGGRADITSSLNVSHGRRDAVLRVEILEETQDMLSAGWHLSCNHILLYRRFIFG